ncbi:hypothetical protein CLF_110425 [Clonorchis sinensis]|uniref:Uncharacterized protein n=1 Tax=Clonorchis sinensis TaxID=79923 RepID=G7YKP6_CLOSI|nr:hypothetical protein CLF_110425 [Clonorchis sinensis]
MAIGYALLMSFRRQCQDIRYALLIRLLKILRQTTTGFALPLRAHQATECAAVGCRRIFSNLMSSALRIFGFGVRQVDIIDSQLHAPSFATKHLVHYGYRPATPRSRPSDKKYIRSIRFVHSLHDCEEKMNVGLDSIRKEN